MALPASTRTQTPALIADRYSLDLTRPMTPFGAGLAAFSATDQRSADSRLVAIAAGRFAPPRLRCLQALDRPIDNLMAPVAHGVGPRPGGGEGYYVICNAPPGEPVSLHTEPWSEGALLEHVLRPMAQVLISLQDLGITHRAIRPDNVFSIAPSQPVILGAAWAGPPALLQPPRS
jgi:eukaryotic-like serine/threonine-protein kinase